MGISIIIYRLSDIYLSQIRKIIQNNFRLIEIKSNFVRNGNLEKAYL